MNIYQFVWSDGYHSCVLLHDKKFNKEELEKIYVESTNVLSTKYIEWLVKEKGFKKNEYTLLSFDCGSTVFEGGDDNG